MFGVDKHKATEMERGEEGEIDRKWWELGRREDAGNQRGGRK